MQELHQETEWSDIRADGTRITREVAGFTNQFDSKIHESGGTRYCVLRQGVVQDHIQTVLTPKEGNGVIDMYGRKYISASVKFPNYPEHGVWLLIDTETLEPIKLIYGKNEYAIVGFGEFTHGEFGNPQNYNAQLWRTNSPGQFALPAMVDRDKPEIKEIYQPRFSK